MNLHNKKIELVAPAGNIDSLNAAIGEGADAVYLGLKSFNARERAKNFSYREIEAIIDKLHSMSKKVYITLNTIFEEREKRNLYNILKFLNSLKPDAVIIQDLGLLYLINNYFKDLKIHASTQMNISNIPAVNFLSKYGIKRVILSRELSFDEIKKIRENTNLELEIFIHGALCICASGLCLFSSYIKRKSANRGQCIQPCRALYNNGIEKKAFFSPKDLMLIDYVPDLIEIGINSFKIEGRMKSSNYVATVVKAYRYLIDNYQNNKFEAIKKAKSILKEDFAREKTTFLFLNKKNNDFLEQNNITGIGLYIGNIKNVIRNENKTILMLPKSQNIVLSNGDLVRIHSTDDKRRTSFKITEIKNDKQNYFITSPIEIKKNDSVYLLEKAISRKKYHRVIPKNLNKYKRHPGNSNPPEIEKKELNFKYKLTNGIYIKLHSFKDIFTIQSIKFEKIILHLTDYNYNNLINEELLKKNNISKSNIILYLEPYLSEIETETLKQKLHTLIEKGYYLYILNNLAHISLLADEKIIKIAGPYLYTFNSYAIEFLLEVGFDYVISPLENNKKNLIYSTENFNKKIFLMTIFSFPELFYIPSKIEDKLPFSKFFDQFGNNYDLVKTKEKIVVIPENPFSITDKIELLKKYHFEKFIVDFSNILLKKSYFKKIIKYLYQKEKIPQSTRFNWKDGFFIAKNLS